MKRLSTILLSLGCFAIQAGAQADRAILSGTVTDPVGASVAGARVELTDAATGFRREAVTGDAGSYSIGSLPAGVYKAVFSRTFPHSRKSSRCPWRMAGGRTRRRKMP
jgi:hypothetical protein